VGRPFGLAASICSIPVVLREFTIVKRLRVLLVAALVAVWMVPDARAMAVGVHLLFADHHQSNHESTGGHHETNPRLESSHAHELEQAVCTSVGRYNACTLTTPAAGKLIAVSSEPGLHSDVSTTPSPPVPLFLSHCSLLI
jgi:hypothetical protein